jgi:hypothetical protein
MFFAASGLQSMRLRWFSTSSTKSETKLKMWGHDMFDTTPVTIQLTYLISAGTTEDALLLAAARLFPNLTTAELSRRAPGRQGAALIPQ